MSVADYKPRNFGSGKVLIGIFVYFGRESASVVFFQKRIVPVFTVMEITITHIASVERNIISQA
jgi:hypothetical protein